MSFWGVFGVLVGLSLGFDGLVVALLCLLLTGWWVVGVGGVVV